MIVDRVIDEQFYSCADCGTLRTKAEGGTVFTVCDGCWERHHQPHETISAKLLAATREQLIEEVLRLRGEIAALQRLAQPGQPNEPHH